MHKKDIRLYGAERCHKTRYYINLLKEKNLDFDFLDVEKEEDAAQELRGLYTTGKLNFPTILIQDKKLRNPSIEEIDKWLDKKGIIDEAQH
jgi:arsenate reductase-like glutaredoxin family protein